VIINFISNHQIHKKFNSIIGSYDCMPAIHSSIPCDVDARITVEIADTNTNVITHVFDPGTDFRPDRSDLHKNMFIQRER
jgi:hypothetical protein